MIPPFPKPLYVTRPILPPLEQYAAALGPVWQARWLTNSGAQHQRLEHELSEHLGSPGISLFANGTVALIVAIQSLRLRGEVITTPFTFPATLHVLSWNGLTPVFCDVEPETLTLDPARIEEHITGATTGILGVHVYGNPCHIPVIQDIAQRHGLRVVYDAAHAFGTELDGVGIGCFGDVSMFSFHATKLFHTAEGGALTYPDVRLKRRIDLLKNFGIEDEETVSEAGINGKMNELQAVLGLVLLGRIDAERKRRAAIAAIYRERFAAVPGIAPLPEPRVSRHSYQYFPVRVKADAFGMHRNALHDALRRYNVFARKYFFPLCSDYPCYRHLPSARPDRLPVARTAADEVLILPFYGDLTSEDVHRVCDIISEIRHGERRPSP